MSLSSIEYFTESTRILSRVSFLSKGSFLSRTMVSVMSVPTLPRILSTASLSDMPLTSWPSILTIRSFAIRPALAAGVPSMGETTLMTPFSIVTSMPSPPNSPRVWTLMSSNCFLFM